MEAKTYSPEYIELQNKLKLHMAGYYEAEKLSLEDMLAIFELLADTETYEELNSFIQLFSSSFPVLKDFLEVQKNMKATDTQADISTMVGKLIKK